MESYKFKENGTAKIRPCEKGEAPWGCRHIYNFRAQWTLLGEWDALISFLSPQKDEIFYVQAAVLETFSRTKNSAIQALLCRMLSAGVLSSFEASKLLHPKEKRHVHKCNKINSFFFFFFFFCTCLFALFKHTDTHIYILSLVYKGMP